MEIQIIASDYYRELEISEKYKLIPTAEDALIKLLKNIEVTKAAGINKISEKLLNS